MNDLTVQEMTIIDFLREARPYESILITKDQMGRPDTYLITRTQKVIISQVKIEAIKERREK